MKLYDPTLYKHHIDPFVRYINRYDISKLSEYCAGCGLPLLVAYKFAYDNGFIDSDIYENEVARLEQFYGVK